MLNAVQSAVFIPIVMTIGSSRGGGGIIIWIWRRSGLFRNGSRWGTLVAFIFYAGSFFNPINQVAQVLVQMQGAQAAGRTRAQPARHRAEDPRCPPPPHRAGALAPTRPPRPFPAPRPRRVTRQTSKTLEFRHVDFSYEPGEPILQDFNLTVRSGETIALSVRAGGARAPIVNLAARFYEPTGREASLSTGSIPRTQSCLGITPIWVSSSKVRISFGGTVRENIRLRSALKRLMPRSRKPPAWSMPDTSSVPWKNGYDTDVGEGGNRLSRDRSSSFPLPAPYLRSPGFSLWMKPPLLSIRRPSGSSRKD